MSNTKTITALLEEIAARIVLAQPDAREEFHKIILLVEELEKRSLEVDDVRCAELAHVCHGKLLAALDSEDDIEVQRAFDTTSKMIMAMQSPAPSQKHDPTGHHEAVENVVTLPEWVEEKTFSDFLIAQKYALDEIESNLLELEKGRPESLTALRRRIHTSKGEAGAVGQEQMEQVFHALEDALDTLPTIPSPQQIDYLLTLKDWLGSTLDRLHERKEPNESADRVLARAGLLLTSKKTASPEMMPGGPIAGDLTMVHSTHSSKPGVVPIRETVKIDLAHVDNLVELIGELMIIESMVINSPELAEVPSLRFKRHVNQLTKISRDLQHSAMHLRMVPVRGIFQKMSRLVRDLSRKSGKDVRLHISGEGTEMDRSMVERLADPLIHLIRNSVDHGIEPPTERVARGKSEESVIHLEARHEGGSIAIEIRDDGRGLDRVDIRQRALQRGLIKESDQVGEGEIQQLIFLPGFSTAKHVSEISGRGVGLDVVKKNVESMRGRVLVSSTPGHGTAFKLVLPLTLAIIDGMLIGCGAEKYIIPTLSIVESIKPSREMVRTFTGRREIINIRGEIMALFRLAELFQIPNAKLDPTESIVVVVESFGKKVALLVDEVITQQQVVIKGSGDRGSLGAYFSGATILADGRVGLILNAHELCNQGERLSREHRDAAGVVQRRSEPEQG